MYLNHFGLRESPFSLTPDPRYLYMTERHREALALLLYGIGEGGSFVVLTGEVGTGKTTLSRTLLEQVPPQLDVALLLNPRLSAGELVGALCDDLRVSYPPGAISLKVLVDALNRHLLRTHAEGRRTVVILDEAQDLSHEALEQVRLLTNLETARDKLLQVILIGQPELNDILQRHDLRQLAQRVTARYHLGPLNASETGAYIRHRLAVAGLTRAVFPPATQREIYRLSGGIPRLINILCDRALLGAYARDKTVVDRAILRRAAGETLGPQANRRSLTTLMATLLLGGLLALGGDFIWRSRTIAPSESPSISENPLPATSPVATVSEGAVTGTESPPPIPVALPPPPVEPLSPALVAASNALRTAPAETSSVELYALWGQRYEQLPGEGLCPRALAAGLRCFQGHGKLALLRQMNLPALLPLVLPGGTSVRGLLVGLVTGEATLQVAGTRYPLAAATLESLWKGDFLVLWRPPEGLQRLILRPGTQDEEIRWLRRTLDIVLNPDPTPPTDPTLYDASLRRRVTTFQKNQGLTSDGLVGEQTLLHFTSALRPAGVPWLDRPMEATPAVEQRLPPASESVTSPSSAPAG